MTLQELVTETNALADELSEAEQMRGGSALASTASCLNRACGLLRKVCDPTDNRFQADLQVAATAIGAVTPEKIPALIRLSDWEDAVRALGSVASVIGLSDRSLTEVMRVFDACRPPAHPSALDLLAGLNECREHVCQQASNFHGEMSLVSAAARHERERQEHRRLKAVIATLGLVGVSVVVAPLTLGEGVVALLLGGTWAATFEVVKPALEGIDDPAETIIITKEYFQVGTTRINRRRA